MEYVVPCSTQSQFPYLCSAPLRSTHWMPIQGDPGAHEMGFPSHNGDRLEHNRDPSARPNWNPDRPRPFLPRPWRAHGALPAAVVTPRSITGTPTPAPTPQTLSLRCRGFAPPLACSQCGPLLHHRRSVSLTPKPGSRRGSRTSFTYCHQMKPKDK